MQQIVDLIGLIVGFSLTLMILSYVLGDNPLFRIASYLLVGSAAGYFFTLIVYQVLIQRLIDPLLLSFSGSTGQLILAVIPLLASIMLLFKLFPGKLAGIGSLPVAYMVGVGAALVITGAITGTILKQAEATINLFSFQTNGLIEAVIILIGTLSTLIYFHFGTRPTPSAQGAKRLAFINIIAWVGKWFIGITLGALFAGVYLSALSALIERLDFIRYAITDIFLKIGM